MHGIVGLSSLDQRANGGGRGVKNRDLVVLNHFPETTSVRESRHALKHNFCAAQSQGAIGDVGVACDPTDVCGAPEHIVLFQVEGPLGGEGRMQQVAACRVLNAFGLAC